MDRDLIAREVAPKMKKFINEHAYSTGRSGPFVESNLPDPGMLSDVREVRMSKQQVVRFRNDYLLLTYFAALKCGTTVDKLCPFDLMAPFLPPFDEDDE